MRSGHGAEDLIPHYQLINIFRFLLVSLSIDAILQESTIYRRRERLNEMTGGMGLGGAYDAIIERIKAQGGDKSRLGMEALMWVSHAERPLSADELRCALAVELGSTDFNAGNIPSIRTLESCCQGLITVDKEASTVRLIHYTVMEYVTYRPDILSKPHSAMAEICLTYLNSEQVKAIPVNRYAGPLDNSFLNYCSLYWGVHAKRELSDYARSLALGLLQEYDGRVSTELLLNRVKDQDLRSFDPNFRFSGLHCASFFGIAELVAALIETGCCDINERDLGGDTPLSWAASNGHEEVVVILLAQEEIIADISNNYGQTPFSYAAQYGHEGVVRILLEREKVSPDKPDNGGRTPLSHAAQSGHEGVVKILLGREEVNPDKPDNDGLTPLMFAAKHGHEGVIALLRFYEAVAHSAI